MRNKENMRKYQHEKYNDKFLQPTPGESDIAKVIHFSYLNKTNIIFLRNAIPILAQQGFSCINSINIQALFPTV